MQILKKILVGILTLESKLIVRKYKPFVIAVTGSVGKTSTKDAIYSVIKKSRSYVRKSEKSMNSEIGLPLTIIGVPNAWKSTSLWLKNVVAGMKLILFKADYPDCLVLEIGADHPGDIKKVAKWLRPDIAVITKISSTPVHVEFFSSPEQVFEEKASLAGGVKEGGTLILFGDDEKVLAIREQVKDKNLKAMSFGMKDSDSVHGRDYSMYYDGEGRPQGISFEVCEGNACEKIHLPDVIGKTHMYPFLAAASVGRAMNMDLGSIAKTSLDIESPKGRLRLIPGVNGSTLIDDTYNSSPDAAVAALHALKEIQTKGKKIAIMGDMMELGKYSTEEHKKIGSEVRNNADMLVTVGPRSRFTSELALEGGMSSSNVIVLDRSNEVESRIKGLIDPGDIILIKGSQSVRMERATKSLMESPELSQDILVRQEKEWLEKQ